MSMLPKNTEASAAPGSLTTYAAGFVLSIMLTLAAYFAVENELVPESFLITFVVGLAVVQLLVQLLFFLHLGRETKPRWNLVIFLFMVLVVGILVAGSLWIMYNLDYNMMPADMDTYMLEEEGIKPHAEHD